MCIFYVLLSRNVKKINNGKCILKVGIQFELNQLSAPLELLLLNKLLVPVMPSLQKQSSLWNQRGQEEEEKIEAQGLEANP